MEEDNNSLNIADMYGSPERFSQKKNPLVKNKGNLSPQLKQSFQDLDFESPLKELRLIHSELKDNYTKIRSDSDNVCRQALSPIFAHSKSEGVEEYKSSMKLVECENSQSKKERTESRIPTMTNDDFIEEEHNLIEPSASISGFMEIIPEKEETSARKHPTPRFKETQELNQIKRELKFIIRY